MIDLTKPLFLTTQEGCYYLKYYPSLTNPHWNIGLYDNYKVLFDMEGSLMCGGVGFVHNNDALVDYKNNTFLMFYDKKYQEVKLKELCWEDLDFPIIAWSENIGNFRINKNGFSSCGKYKVL